MNEDQMIEFNAGQRAAAAAADEGFTKVIPAPLPPTKAIQWKDDLNVVKPTEPVFQTEYVGKWQTIADDMTSLLKAKRDSYGNNLACTPEIMKLMYPSGITHEQLDDFLILVRMVDKMFRIANGANFKLGEDAWKDLAGYAMCVLHDRGDP